MRSGNYIVLAKLMPINDILKSHCQMLTPPEFKQILDIYILVYEDQI